MKSCINILRVFLLIFFLFVLNIGAIAQPKVTLNVGSEVLKGIAEITWITDKPGITGIPGIYTIERQVTSLPPSAAWLVIATIPYVDAMASNVFKDTISSPYCSATSFSYRVRFVSISGSEDASSLPGNTPLPLSDLTSPAEVKNLNIGLLKGTSGSYTRITWDKITNDFIARYDIQRTTDVNAWGAVIGSAHADSSGFNDKTVDAGCGSSYKYIVLTYDRCGNHSAPDYKQYVQPINIDLSMPVQCDKSATLSWNSNNAMPGGISGFKLSRSQGSGSLCEIATVSSTTSSYIDKDNFKDGVTYGYSVKAFSNNSNYTSSSCHLFQQYEAAILPDTVYITQVSVENDSYIKVGYYFSAENSVTRLILERSEDNGTNYHAIDSILFPVPQKYFLNDTNVDVHSHSYYYRLVVIDDCETKKRSMNPSKSILLNCLPLQTMNTLEWNSYETWLQGVEGYDIYRSLNKEPATIQIVDNVGAYTNTYSELLTSIDSTKMPCYWVEAKENPGNPYLQSAVSKSNTCCVIQEPVFFLPNAFRPDGINKLFRPVESPRFIQIESFKMTVFSRWGQQIFETDDIVKGWNGTVNGQDSPTGLYSYIITFKSLDDKEYTKRGTVMLVR
jgi:gliding motility-associated-like protein